MTVSRSRVLLVAVTLVACMFTALVSVGFQSPSEARVTRAHKKWVPGSGVVFNNPTARKQTFRHKHVIVKKILRAVRASEPGEFVRFAAWNFDSRRYSEALVDADRRGVHVQVVVSGWVDTENWRRVARRLNRDKDDKSFAHRCHGGCRSTAKIMHTKLFLFSRVHSAKNISMFGSPNFTNASAGRQWNDLVTVHQKRLYRYFVRVFRQLAADKPVKRPHDVFHAGPYRVTLFPVRHANPMVHELDRVRCHGVTGGGGNGHGRTVIRIAIAGWYDAFGAHIAQQLRRLWEHGCDVQVVATDVGRGVEHILRSRRGRGPIPLRTLGPDRNGDGIPELYLHMKSLVVSGVYAGDTNASAVFTGSPNWSSRAARSEELWVRILGREGVTRHYVRHINRLMRSRQTRTLGSYAGMTLPSSGGQHVKPKHLPRWFEND